MGTSDRRELGTLRITSNVAPAEGVVMELSGELDLSTVPIFINAMEEILDGEPAAVELDLSKLGFIDSSGVGAYVTAYRRAMAQGCRLSVGGRSALVDRVLHPVRRRGSTGLGVRRRQVVLEGLDGVGSRIAWQAYPTPTDAYVALVTSLGRIRRRRAGYARRIPNMKEHSHG